MLVALTAIGVLTTTASAQTIKVFLAGGAPVNLNFSITKPELNEIVDSGQTHEYWNLDVYEFSGIKSDGTPWYTKIHVSCEAYSSLESFESKGRWDWNEPGEMDSEQNHYELAAQGTMECKYEWTTIMYVSTVEGTYCSYDHDVVYETKHEEESTFWMEYCTIPWDSVSPEAERENMLADWESQYNVTEWEESN